MLRICELVHLSVSPSVRHAFSNINTECGNFAMACHRLRIQVLFFVFTGNGYYYTLSGHRTIEI